MESFIYESNDRPALYNVNLADFHALVQHRQNISQESLEKILRVALQMAIDQDNFLSNRYELLRITREFADRVNSDLRAEILNQLEPVARGKIQESGHYPKAADAKNPYSAFKFAFGTLEDVQAMAIVAFAAFASHSEMHRDRISDVLLPQFYDPRAKIREGACNASRFCNEIDPETQSGLISTLRDPDANVVSMAFFAIEKQPGWKLNPTQRRALLLAVRFAAQSPSALARSLAARALQTVKQYNSSYPNKEVNELLEVFRNDPAYSVRSVIAS
jgi:hypothetical protein